MQTLQSQVESTSDTRKRSKRQLSQTMQSWKKIKDIEHGAGQKQWEKLSTIKDQINEKLDIEYDKNIDLLLIAFDN